MIDFIKNILPTLAPLCVIMSIMFIIDTITGVTKAKITGTFSSSKLKSAIPKYLLYFCFVVVCICVDFVLIYYLDFVEVPAIITKIVSHYPITILCKLFIIFVEIVSIIENCKQAGLSIPSWFVDFIDNIKKYFE